MLVEVATDKIGFDPAADEAETIALVAAEIGE